MFYGKYIYMILYFNNFDMFEKCIKVFIDQPVGAYMYFV